MSRHRIEEFLGSEAFAVVGASDDMRKFGARVLACYRSHGKKVFAINPNRDTVQEQPSYARLTDLPERVPAVSIVTPPEVTEEVVEDAARAGARHLWMQPGAESARAVERASELGMTVIAGGPCVLVELGC